MMFIILLYLLLYDNSEHINSLIVKSAALSVGNDLIQAPI